RILYAGIVFSAGFFACCNLENSENSESSSAPVTLPPPTEEPAPTAVTTTTADTSAKTSIDVSDVIPEAIQTPRVQGDRLSYTIINIYSENDYYTVEISGVKYNSYEESETDIDTTYVNGELYGDFRLDLLKRGEVIDSLKINVPRDDRFLILESVTENLSYGCEIISNKREFSADEFPDLIQLDFHIINEVEAPQYARYFAVFGGKIAEVPVYENSEEAAPYGTHLEMKSAGEMVQHLVAEKPSGGYTVIKYEYSFDVENKCLNRKQVKFTGWED
ncbi:MAG: hypothetical protein K2G32_03500, partial [Oscillospiraceae bacterium]|nr:hypothetical protein [Oscillospiraceae bacterium]